MHESAFLSPILVQIKVKFQGECIFFSLSLSNSLSLSPGRDFKGHHFQLKKKSQRKIHVNTNVAFHRAELRAVVSHPQLLFS